MGVIEFEPFLPVYREKEGNLGEFPANQEGYQVPCSLVVFHIEEGRSDLIIGGQIHCDSSLPFFHLGYSNILYPRFNWTEVYI